MPEHFIRRQVGLEYLSVFGLPVLDYAELAAEFECDFISLNLRGSPNPLVPPMADNLRTDSALRQKLSQRVSALGLSVCLVEGFTLSPELASADYGADLDCVAELGASRLCAVSLDRNFDRSCEQFVRLCEAASHRGLLVTTELGAGAIRSFDIARKLLEAVSQPNFRLLIDTMHFFRSGARVSDLDTLPSGAIGHVQLCDVPMPAVIDNYMEEALYERKGLGEGDLPLAEFLQKITPDIPVGIEIPARSVFEAGDKHYHWLRQSVRQARHLLEREDYA